MPPRPKLLEYVHHADGSYSGPRFAFSSCRRKLPSSAAHVTSDPAQVTCPECHAHLVAWTIAALKTPKPTRKVCSDCGHSDGMNASGTACDRCGATFEP